MTPRTLIFPVVLGLLALLTTAPACTPGEAGEEASHNPVHIDSIFPMEEEVRRFREGLEAPSGLSGGAPSLETLVDRYLRGLEAGDGEGIARMALDRAEFAYLYFPHTQYVEGPYELSPAFVWYQLGNRSSRGLTRALRLYEGETLHDVGVDCPEGRESFGDGWIHHGCAVLGELPTGEEVREVLFGSILELDGHFKFVGFANQL
jgi:hypothetical protein